MANGNKSPTETSKDTSKDTPSSSKTMEKLSAIFKDLDGRSIRSILTSGQVILHTRMAEAIDQMLVKHEETFKDKSFLSRGNSTRVPTIILYAIGIAWEDAGMFLAEAGPLLSTAGISPLARLREGSDAQTLAQPVELDIEFMITSEDIANILDFLDDSKISTKEALEIIRGARAKRATGDSAE